MGCFSVVSFFTVLLLILGFLAYYQLNNRLEASINDLEASLNALDDPNATTGFESTFIYDRNGKQLWEIFGQGRRQRVEFADIPESVKQATIAVEDDDFYSNPGFDVSSNIRAVGQFFQRGRVVSGASTITQQLVRNVVFDPEYRAERSARRKIEEIALATVLTQRMSKDEILELYLNTIYYGNLAYGIEAASQTYFGKPASQLELNEAALLAGLPQLPAVIDPLNPDPAIQAQVLDRQYLVLDLMVEEGYITEAEAAAAKAAPLNYVSPEVPLEAPHFTLYAVEQLEELLLELGKPPEFLADGGLKVYTSVDLEWQDIAQRAVENTVNELRDAHNLTNSAAVIIHPPSGEILAMVGSVDYNNEAIDGQVNVALALRQPGSTLKPFTYAATMEQGWTPATIIWDTETAFPIQGAPDYVPANYDRRFHGPLRIRDALANSYNVPAVKALSYVSPEYLISLLKRMGTESIHDEPGYYGAGLALTLGGGDITLLELTSNYATLSRGGVYVPTQVILCVIDKNDNIIYQYEDRCIQNNRGALTNQTRSEYVRGTPVLDPRIAFIISDILSDNAARTPAMGSNSPLNTGSLLTSVKTGTTDSFRDNWTVGFTHDIAVGVWSGNSNNDPMVDISGLAGAAPTWNAIISEIYRRFPMPPSVLLPPPGVSQRQICNVRALRDPATGCSYQVEWFLDSPPLLPDGQGNLVQAPQTNVPPPTMPEYGPRIEEIEPGIVRVAVRPLNDLQKNVALSQNPNLYVAPQYCMVPQEVAHLVIDAQTLIFVKPPDDPNQQRSAYAYAANAGIPILPQVPCTAETIQAFGPVAPGIVGQIVSPAAGQTVSGIIPIYGVVDYPDGRFFDYYKVEVRGGPFPDWTTMGEVHHNEVLQPAVLETFYAEALPPGAYELRLWVQGEVPVDPYVIPINLVSP
jgi:penicillin-binding protein 1C